MKNNLKKLESIIPARKFISPGFAFSFWAVFVISGIMGVNFGRHWDEHLQLDLINQSIHYGILYPRDWYYYPSGVYDLSVLSNLGFILHHYSSHVVETSSRFYLHTRQIFVVATSLGGFGVYVAARRISGLKGGVIASGVYFLSWELSYHSRWIAPDAILCSVAGVFLGAAVWSWQSKSRWAYLLPALVAGFAASIKYQGVVLLIPAVILALVQLKPKIEHWKEVTIRLLGTGCAFVGGFLLLTPGAVLQPHLLLHQFGMMNHQYHSLTGWPNYHGAPNPEATSSHLQYFVEMMRYVLLYLPSHYVLISIGITAIAAIGLWRLFHQDRWLCGLVIAPVALLTISYSTYVNIVVRNFLIFLPFMALLTGIGGAWLLSTLKLRWRYVVVAVLVGMALINTALGLRTANEIRSNSISSAIKSAASFMDAHPTDHFAVSRNFRAQAHHAGVSLGSNVVTGTRNAQYEVFLFSDVTNNTVPVLRYWPAIFPNSITTFGAPEINVSYYPQWDMNFVVMLNSVQFRNDIANQKALGFKPN